MIINGRQVRSGRRQLWTILWYYYSIHLEILRKIIKNFEWAGSIAKVQIGYLSKNKYTAHTIVLSFISKFCPFTPKHNGYHMYHLLQH
jgi:hypothetical protein